MRAQSVGLGKDFGYGLSKGEATEDSCEAHLSHEISDSDENKCLMIVFYILNIKTITSYYHYNININFIPQPSRYSY